jgi:glyoxylase-like metal-dependent hydrolase (beta-lactamase superfamily II)
MENQQYNSSRREFLASAGILTAGIIFLPRDLFARQTSPVNTIIEEARKGALTVTKLRGNISVIEGSGGNVAVFTGPQGKLMIDAGINVSEMKMKAALSKISKDPIKMLINSHWHFDHASGNEWVHKAGATIIAQENTKKHLSETVRVVDWNYTFPAAPKGALPSVIFRDNYVVNFNGEHIKLKKYGNAHTDSDISIYFPKADVLHVADTWWNGHYPFIDYSTGGNIKGMITAAQENVKKVTEHTIIIPGHGPVGNKAQLIEYRDMLMDVSNQIAIQKRAGASMAEVIASKPTKAYDAKWGTFVISGDFFCNMVYRGL